MSSMAPVNSKNWRQGSVLTTESATKFGLKSTDSGNTCVVVISHDCDIEADVAAESEVEIIVGSIFVGDSGALRYGKTLRELHLDFNTPSGNRVVKLEPKNKTLLKKAELLVNAPDSDFSLSNKDKTYLQTWLALRYRRAAFPTAFNDAMDKCKLYHWLENKLRSSNYKDLVSAVYFQLNTNEELRLSLEENFYHLKITILVVGNMSDELQNNMESLESLVDEQFTEKTKVRYTANSSSVENDEKIHSGIIFEGVSVRHEETFTVADMRQSQQWRSEHVSRRSESNVYPMEFPS